MLVQRARDNLSAVAFCNLVGGQDELVFDGHSVVIDHEGTVLARAPQFAEALTLCTVDLQARPPRGCATRACARRCASALPEVRHAGHARAHARASRARSGGDVAPLLEPEAEVYAALVPRRARLRAPRTASSTSCSASRAGSTPRSSLLIAVDALGADRVTAS